MKAHIVYILFSVILFGSNAQAQKPTAGETEHVNKFIEAVNSHNQNGVFKLLDKKYRKEQLKFLGGNKEQLVNELFGGSELNSDVYINVKLAEIESIEINSAIVLKGGEGTTWMFTLKTKEKEVICTILMVKSGKKFGFVGAMG